MIPQMMETIAPIKKAMAVHIPCSVRKVTTMNIMMMKIKQIEYSAFKNSLAPSIILNLPLRSCLRVREECSLDG